MRTEIVLGADPAEAEANRKILRQTLLDLYRSAGRPDFTDLADDSGLERKTITDAIRREDKLPERATVVALAVALGGDGDQAARLWAAARPARRVDGGWLSRVLSVTHAEVLALAAAGHRIEAIAAELGWTVDGVHDYFDDIIERLRVATIEEAVWIAVETGYLIVDDGVVSKPASRRGGSELRGGEHGYLVNAIAHRIRERLSGLAPGTPVPTQHRLADEFETSRTTVFYALRMLKAEGTITGGGKGHPLIVVDTQSPPKGPSWTTS